MTGGSCSPASAPPLEASVLAKRLHAPSLTIVLEGGSIGPRMLPGRLPVSTNEMRAAHDAFMLTSINDLFLYGQRGRYDYGFIGAGQLDQYGNVNTSYIGDPDHPKVRLPGQRRRQRHRVRAAAR